MAHLEPLYWEMKTDLKVHPVGEPSLLQTAEPVEANHGTLWLSNLDQAGCQSFTDTLYVFKARAAAPRVRPAPEDAEKHGEFEKALLGAAQASSPTELNNNLGTGTGAAAAQPVPAAARQVEVEGNIGDEFKLKPAALLRDTLSRALVLFYPFTGRLRLSSERRYEINLTGEGAVFVEAEANMTLAQLGCERGIMPPPEAAKQLLVITVHDPSTRRLMAAQVTRFQCGGWVLGITMNHEVVDGVSALKFMRVWAKLAKLALPTRPAAGSPSCSYLSTSIPEIDAAALQFKFAVDRSCLKQRSPLQVSYDHAAHTAPSGAHTWNGSATENQGFAFRINGRDLQALKQKILHQQVLLEQTAEGCRPLTTFEVLAAVLWRARTRALDMADQDPTQLQVWVNFSNRLLPPLPTGYMGNSVVKTMCATTAGQLCSGPLSHAVALVQQGLAAVTDHHIRSFIDYLGQIQPETPGAATPFSCLALNSWMRLGFQLVDFGWGEPLAAGPATDILALDTQCRMFSLPVHGGDGMDINLLVALPFAVATEFEQQLRHELCCHCCAVFKNITGDTCRQTEDV